MQPFELVRFCPRCGHAAGPEPLIRFHCGHCDLTLFFNPTVSASAFIFQEDGSILLIRRARDPGKGLLGTIGGFVDFGETAEEALRREIREEVHLEVSDFKYLTSATNNYIYAGITYPVLDLFFTCHADSSIAALPGDDVDSLESRKIAEISASDLAFGSMRLALEKLKERF